MLFGSGLLALSLELTQARLVCRRNSRQGMSIVAAINVTIERSEFSHTQGACPQAGIDIEPSSEAEPVSNLTLRGISCRNNTVRPPRLPPPSGLHSSQSGSEPSLRTGHAAAAAARPVPAPPRRAACGVGAGRRASVRSELVGARGRLQRQRDRAEHGPSQEHREPNRLHGLNRATSFKRKRPKGNGRTRC